MTIQEKHRFRLMLRVMLGNLDAKLGDFEQTTHAAYVLHQASFNEVLMQMSEAHADPSAYRFSNLSQAIVSYLKTPKEGIVADASEASE